LNINRTQKGLSVMRRALILLFLAAVIAFSVSACGGGSSGDPLGTDSITLESAASQVDPNGTVVLTATVKNVSGAAVVGRDVAFGFAPNSRGIIKESGSTAGLSASEVSTNSDGKAIITYTAGLTGGIDVVRASIDTDRIAEVYITVETGGASGGTKITLSGSPTSLSAGKNSILAATVTDVSGNLLSGQAVTFAFVTPTTIGSTIATINGLTDGSGRAVAVYTAGSTGTASVEETIQATVGVIGVNGSADLVKITRTAGVTAGYSMAIAATATSLKAGESSVITATVTNTATGTVASGQAVTFAFVAPTTIGSTLTTLNGTTDGSGRAVAVYTAGSTGTASIQETVQANVGTIGVDRSTGAVTITRTASVIAPPAGYSMSIVADATSLIAGQSAIITATVTNTGTGTTASGESVTFAFIAPSTIGSTLTIVNGITDGSGRAVAVYKAGSAGTASVQEAIKATVGIIGVDGSANAVVITREVGGSGGVGVSLSLTADNTTLAMGLNTVIRATVVDADGIPVPGQVVTFNLLFNYLGATLIPLNVTTDALGKAETVYNAGFIAGQEIVRATVSGGATADAVVITTIP
jgi:hypothetical protein